MINIFFLKKKLKINASDERTAEKLIERIESITNSESLTLLDKQFK